MRCLLDKNVLRHAIAGLYFGQRRLLSSMETSALSFWRQVEIENASLFMSPASYHVLRRMDHYREVRLLLESIAVLYPTRYHARWTRRLRQTTGLTGEDAAILALATFGTDQSGGILGVNTVITFDQRMINGYTMRFLTLQRRLGAMTCQLASPFRQAFLPQIASLTDDGLIKD